MSKELALTVEVDASPEHTWLVLTDWARQGEWMLGTRVTVSGGNGRSVGSTLSARTGFGPFGFTDTMTITEWDDRRLRCVVRHTGRLVRGEGEFAVTPAARGGCTVHWVERLELPVRPLGEVYWPLARPAFAAGVRYSLRRLARLCAGRPDHPSRPRR
ncbi:MAG TPA: SRPBCC family protein [Pseudonocardia sp.]|jgi:uncharacterized protein YndB with AHSA1/START domain